MGINRQSIPDSDPLFSITIVPVELVLGRDDFSNKCLRAVLVARIVAVIVDAMHHHCVCFSKRYNIAHLSNQPALIDIRN